MDFDLTEEQRLLKDSVEGLLGDAYDFESRKKYMKEPGGWSKAMWGRFAEQGLLGLPFAEDDGGFGAGAVETMIVMEALGKALVLEPYLATVVLGAGLVNALGSDAQREAILPAVAQGKRLLAFAHGERPARYRLDHVETEARRDGSGYVLRGQKGVVLHGDAAQTLVVSARTSGSAKEPKGISLFLVERDAKGVNVRGYPTIDGLRAAEIGLDGVKLGRDALLGPEGGAYDAIEHTVDRAIAALCAEAVGLMETLNATTLEYLKTRKQFGVPIGSFQALQHRMVEMTVEHETSRSMSVLAALSADSHDRRQRRRAISGAKVQIGKSGRFVGEQSIQLHGGIGMTDEYVAGHYFKRLRMIDQTFGDVDHHLDRFAAA